MRVVSQPTMAFWPIISFRTTIESVYKPRPSWQYQRTWLLQEPRNDQKYKKSSKTIKSTPLASPPTLKSILRTPSYYSSYMDTRKPKITSSTHAHDNLKDSAPHKMAIPNITTSKEEIKAFFRSHKQCFVPVTTKVEVVLSLYDQARPQWIYWSASLWPQLIVCSVLNTHANGLPEAQGRPTSSHQQRCKNLPLHQCSTPLSAIELLFQQRMFSPIYKAHLVPLTENMHRCIIFWLLRQNAEHTILLTLRQSKSTIIWTNFRHFLCRLYQPIFSRHHSKLFDSCFSGLSQFSGTRPSLYVCFNGTFQTWLCLQLMLLRHHNQNSSCTCDPTWCRSTSTSASHVLSKTRRIICLCHWCTNNIFDQCLHHAAISPHI